MYYMSVKENKLLMVVNIGNEPVIKYQFYTLITPAGHNNMTILNQYQGTK